MADHRFRSATSALLFGRRHECALLDEMLDHAGRGHSAVRVLRGEAGIGKTALLNYLVSAADGFTVAQCTGVESEMELPFAGLQELCSPFLSGLGRLPDPQGQALSVALGLETAESPDKFLVGLAALGLMAAASDDCPVLCVVEDAHWLDHSSAQVLGFIGRRLQAERIGLVFAARPSVTAPDHLASLPQLRIDGLQPAHARALLDSVARGRVDERIRVRILDEAQGNPLALLEFGARMGTVGFAGGFAAHDAASLSRRIEDEYLNRLRSLPPDTQQLLLLVAADPVGDTAVVLAAAARCGLAFDAAEAAIDAGMLSIGASVRFRHPLWRSAVYRVAGIERRRAAHHALAQVTDPERDPDRRAWHRAYAAPAPDETVAADLIGSATRAQARGGMAAAAAFWDRAVALTPDGRNRASRAIAAASVKFAAGDLSATSRLLGEAQTGPLTDLEQVTAELLRAQVAFASSRGGDAPSQLLAAARRLEPLNGDLAWQTYLQALIATSYAGQLGDPEVRRAITQAAQQLPLNLASAPPIQLLVRGVATWMTEGFAVAAPMLKDAVRQYRNAPPDSGFIGFGFNVMAMHLCDVDAWFEFCSAQTELARRSGTLSWLPFALDGLAEFYAHAGEFTQTQALLTEAERIDPIIAATTSPRIALLLAAWRGDAPTAHQRVQSLTEAATAAGEGWLLTYADYAKAVLYNGLADYAAAADTAQEASSTADHVPALEVRGLYELVEAAARSDQLDRAATAAAKLAAVAAAAGTDWAHGMAARSHAFLADGDMADGLYQEAIELLSRTRMAIHLARTRLVYGEWLRRQNRRADARAQLRPAYESLSAMGAHGFAQRARRELQATGEKVRRRGGPTMAALTPQEEQIAQLARERRTNSEIGAQLFLSARTVEWHLGNVFAKLGIAKRRDLDAALVRRETGSFEVD